jgi:hypothetical protein
VGGGAAEEGAGNAPDALTRVAAAGRVLGDGDTLRGAGVAPGHCVHVAVRPAGVPARGAGGGAGGGAHAGSAAPGSPPDAEALRDEDITALRLALEAELRALAAHAAGAAAPGAPGSRRGGAAPWPGAAREGDAGDFCLGVAFGLLLGFVGFVCLLEPAAPRRLKAGLFLGARRVVPARGAPAPRSRRLRARCRAAGVCLNVTGAFAKLSGGARDGGGYER